MKFKSDIEVQAGLRDGGNDIGTAGQILSSTGSQTNWIDQSSIVASESKLVVIECKNTSGVTISKGTPVYQTGTVGATDVIEIDAADASDEDKMAAIGLLQTDLVNNAFGKVVITGELLNITTSPIDGVTPVTGDTIYVKSGGGLTLTKPTGVNFIQNIGLVGKVSGGNSGSITVSSIMRSNDVPTPLYIDHTNQRLGIGLTNPAVTLHVDGFARLNGGLQMNTANATIYQILDSALRFGTNNTERMRITSTGNVGIGTTNPNFKLHVDGGSAMFDTDTGNNPLYIARNSSTSEALKIYVDDTEAFFESIQDETGGDHGRFAFKMDGDSPNAYTRWLHGSTERMRLTAAGNLGIGITSPLQPLSIENSSSPLIKIRNTTNGGGAAIEFNDNGINQQSGRITYYHADSQSQGGGSSFWLTGEDDQALVLANNGRMVVQKSGSTTEVGYGFYDDINTGMYRVSADALGFATGGTRRLDMNSSGVRIGTGSRVSTILDQDNMSSNSNTALATQQSIKAYVDNSVAAIITPAAPSTVTSTIVGETIEIAFNQSTTSDIDYYQVWSSDDGGDYGIIGQITSDDFSSTMTVVDTTFVTGGTMSYRIYAVRQGVYSAAATTSKSYTVSALSVTSMTVVNLNTAYYIQYEKPNSRFIDHIEIYMDSQTTLAALNRSNATLVYSGQNASYMRSVGTSSNFHQFWVEVVTS